MWERGTSNNGGQFCLASRRALRTGLRTAGACRFGLDVYGQPQRMDGLEREPKFRARLSFLERDHPESAGADALGQFALRHADCVASLAHDGTNNG